MQENRWHRSGANGFLTFFSIKSHYNFDCACFSLFFKLNKKYSEIDEQRSEQW